MIEKFKNGITFKMSGRSGNIYYKESDRLIDFYVEMSGTPEYHILIWFEETKYWTIPEDELIVTEERQKIKQKIINELNRQNLKSDIDRQY